MSLHTATSNGGITSTVGDLLKFIYALRSTSKLLKPQVSQNSSIRNYNLAYGFGLEFLIENNDIFNFGLAGKEIGVSCRLYNYHRHNIDLIILGNQTLVLAL
ncbi:hypothetical protein [Clostridium sp. UBA7503]|uniref:hypothetical protein n=1 Tax=Clostridium sp. UBA7503 TaxID=1946377 RepID=UPI003217876B